MFTLKMLSCFAHMTAAECAVNPVGEMEFGGWFDTKEECESFSEDIMDKYDWIKVDEEHYYIHVCDPSGEPT